MREKYTKNCQKIMENPKNCQLPFSLSMDPYFWEDEGGLRYDLTQLSYAEIAGFKNSPIQGLFSHPKLPTPIRDRYYGDFPFVQNLSPLEK